MDPVSGSSANLPMTQVGIEKKEGTREEPPEKDTRLSESTATSPKFGQSKDLQSSSEAIYRDSMTALLLKDGTISQEEADRISKMSPAAGSYEISRIKKEVSSGERSPDDPEKYLTLKYYEGIQDGSFDSLERLRAAEDLLNGGPRNGWEAAIKQTEAKSSTTVLDLMESDFKQRTLDVEAAVYKKIIQLQKKELLEKSNIQRLIDAAGG